MDPVVFALIIMVVAFAIIGGICWWIQRSERPPKCDHDWRDAPGGWQQVDRRGFEVPKNGVTFHLLEQVCLGPCKGTNYVYHEQPPRREWPKSQFAGQDEFNAIVSNADPDTLYLAFTPTPQEGQNAAD